MTRTTHNFSYCVCALVYHSALVYICKHGGGTGKRESVTPERYVTDTSTRSFYRGFYLERYKCKNKRRETLCRRCDSTRQECKKSERSLCGIRWTVRWASGGHAVGRLTTFFSEWNLFLFCLLLLWTTLWNSSSRGVVSRSRKEAV